MCRLWARTGLVLKHKGHKRAQKKASGLGDRIFCAQISEVFKTSEISLGLTRRQAPHFHRAERACHPIGTVRSTEQSTEHPTERSMV